MNRLAHKNSQIEGRQAMELFVVMRKLCGRRMHRLLIASLAVVMSLVIENVLSFDVQEGKGAVWDQKFPEVGWRLLEECRDDTYLLKNAQECKKTVDSAMTELQKCYDERSLNNDKNFCKEHIKLMEDEQIGCYQFDDFSQNKKLCKIYRDNLMEFTECQGTECIDKLSIFRNLLLVKECVTRNIHRSDNTSDSMACEKAYESMNVRVMACLSSESHWSKNKRLCDYFEYEMRKMQHACFADDGHLKELQILCRSGKELALWLRQQCQQQTFWEERTYICNYNKNYLLLQHGEDCSKNAQYYRENEVDCHAYIEDMFKLQGECQKADYIKSNKKVCDAGTNIMQKQRQECSEDAVPSEFCRFLMEANTQEHFKCENADEVQKGSVMCVDTKQFYLQHQLRTCTVRGHDQGRARYRGLADLNQRMVEACDSTDYASKHKSACASQRAVLEQQQILCQQVDVKSKPECTELQELNRMQEVYCKMEMYETRHRQTCRDNARYIGGMI